jgi:hypothetical protein
LWEKRLETDLLPDLANEMKETFRELRRAKVSSKKFDAEIEDYILGDETAGETILGRIEAIGKGRFGQRLAGKITEQEPPAYIKGAIEHIAKLVREDDAGSKKRI